jgi:diguanylate cyclase (GGDEF)-like protein
VQPRGFAARLGGEEFLLVQLDGSVHDVLATLERLRAEVQSQDWREVDPELSVTISIGVAVARVADTQISLLTRADERLYLAKQEGRNRIATGLPGADATRGPSPGGWMAGGPGGRGSRGATPADR